MGTTGFSASDGRKCRSLWCNLRDIYGNELILTDAVAVADREPLLKNLAFAEAKAENSTVTVTYGGETLNSDLDYMVYT